MGPKHLEKLFEKARRVVPSEAAHETPIFLLATAGMRLLPTQQSQDILREVCSYARGLTSFQLPDCTAHIRVILGDVEGMYGWIAANYLLGTFDKPQEKHNNSHRTFGFLDMGGASAQIAFAPNTTEAEKHANDLKLLRLRTVGGENIEHRLFTTTWLRFGVREARSRYVEALESGKKTSSALELLDPCMPKGLQITSDGDVFLPDNKTIHDKILVLKGTGKFNECLKKTQPLLEKDHVCEDDPCLVGGVHVPAIDFDVNHFVGISEYWHTTHEIFQVGEKDKAYDFNTYQTRVSEFCNQDWTIIREGLKASKWGDKVNEKTAAEVCFKASWLINVLHEGIGIPRIGVEKTPNPDHNGTSKVLDNAINKGFIPPFRPINKIDDTEVSWTLGKMVLYVCSLVEPHQAQALPVGFGSNEEGVPSDFQLPSAPAVPSSKMNSTTKLSHPDSASDIVQSVPPLSSGTSRRIPGFLFFLLILGFMLYLILYRRRRARNGYSDPHKHRSISQSNTRGLLARNLPTIFGFNPRRRSENFDLESRSNLIAPDRSEEGGYSDEDFSSDSSNLSRKAGRSSGLAISTNTRGPKALNDGSISRLHNFDTLGCGQGLGIGLAGKASNLGGSTGEIEPPEQLSDTPDTESKSRPRSPTKRSASRMRKMMRD